MSWMQEALIGIDHGIGVVYNRWHEKALSPREKPFLALQRMYGQVKQETRRALRGWLHQWIPFPPCYLVFDMSDYIKYKGTRHEIWIYPHEAYCLQRLDTYVDIVTNLLSVLRAGPGQSTTWKQARARWQTSTTALQLHYAGIEERGLYISTLWPQVELDLQDAEQEWQREGTLVLLERLAEKLASLRASLWQRMHFLLIHEAVHSMNARLITRRGNTIRLISGMATYEFDVREGLNKALVERDISFNECVTDWIAQQILLQVADINDRSGYPAWIVEKLVLVLNREWERVHPALPSLPPSARKDAEHFLYTIYFIAPSVLSSLREALILVTGDHAAWEKVSCACKRFDLQYFPQTDDQWQLFEESWYDLGDLFSPFLNEKERGIPALFGTEFTKLPLAHSKREHHPAKVKGNNPGK